MKSIVFYLSLAILIVIYIPFGIFEDNKIESNQKMIIYDQAMNNAVNDAASSLSQINGNNSEGFSQSYDIDCEKTLSKFYISLFNNLNIGNNKVAQDQIKMYIPLKLIIGYDGYYINAWINVKDQNSGKVSVKELWQPKKSFTYYDSSNKLIFNFTLDDSMKIYDINSSKWIYGKRNDLELKYPDCSILKQANFDGFRRQIIINAIQNDITYYTNKNNITANRYGLTYSMQIPLIQNDKKLSSINNVCFMAFFQGNINNKDYNFYAFGTAKLMNKDKFYGNSINGKSYYHTKDCPILTQQDAIFNTKMDAAAHGYIPCPYCHP